MSARLKPRALLLAALALAASRLPLGAKEVGRLASSSGLTLVFRASPVSNLTYQLDCLAELTSCTEEVYRVHWKDREWSPEDEEAIGRWKALRKAYGREVEFDREAPADPIPTATEHVQLLESIRIAGLMADDWAGHERLLALLMLPPDVRKTEALLARFRPRFERWWAAEGKRQAGRSAKELLSLISRKGLPDFYARVARFYGHESVAGLIVEFDVMVQPGRPTGHARGTQLGRHSVFEVLSGEKPEDRLDVVSHELFHYFHEAAPDAMRAALGALAASPEPRALAAYGLLNEALATALGQGLVSKRLLPPWRFRMLLEKDDRLYADPFINSAAVALIEPAEDWLARGLTLRDEAFAPEYLRAVLGGLGARADAPGAWFRNAFLVSDDALAPARRSFAKRMRPNSAWSHGLQDGALEFVKRHPGLSGALFVKPSDLEALRAWAPILGEEAVREILALARTRPAFAFGVWRSPKAYVAVFVAPDSAEAEGSVTAFAAVRSLPRGLLAPSDPAPVDP